MFNLFLLGCIRIHDFVRYVANIIFYITKFIFIFFCQLSLPILSCCLISPRRESLQIPFIYSIIIINISTRLCSNIVHFSNL